MHASIHPIHPSIPTLPPRQEADDTASTLSNNPTTTTGSVFEFHLYTWAFGETPDDKVR